MADTWVDMPDTMGNADHSLHSGMTTALQGNQDRAYEQSICHMADALLSTVDHQMDDDDVWELYSGWLPMPIPLRYKRDGTFRDVEVAVETDFDRAGGLRACLLPTPAVTTDSVDPTDGIVDVDYDDANVGAGGGTASFSITPTAPGFLFGDGAVGGIIVPVGWLVFLVWADTIPTPPVYATQSIYQIDVREAI